MAIEEKYIWAYALKNAIEHNGKAVSESVIAGLFNHGLEKEKIKETMPKVNEISKKVNSMKLEEQEKEYNKYKDLIGHRPEREGLPELEDVRETGVVMRFSPAPSGPMHTGNVMTGILSSLYVKKYGGKFYLQIEDTNPENIYAPAYGMIAEDADWIFENVTEVIIQSDRMKIYYSYIEKLLNIESAYVCTCNSEKFRELIEKKKPCPCRNLSKKENLERWKKMLDKNGYKEGEAVIRFKSDLNNPNPAMRDFPLARINLAKHPRQGNKYRVWPLMNLAVAVDDIELKKTHVIRAKEHRDNSTRQEMIYKVLGLENKFPKTYFLGRWNFNDLELSKSKTRKAISDGKFSGWDDIRLPFIQPLRKRGYQPEAFEKMAIQRGISEVDKVISQKDFFEVLNGFNREILRDKTRKASFSKCDEKDSNIIVLMPDNKKIFGKSDIKAKKQEIVYFEKFGYAKLNPSEGKGRNANRGAKQVFWFCHE